MLGVKELEVGKEIAFAHVAGFLDRIKACFGFALIKSGSPDHANYIKAILLEMCDKCLCLREGARLVEVASEVPERLSKSKKYFKDEQSLRKIKEKVQTLMHDLLSSEIDKAEAQAREEKKVEDDHSTFAQGCSAVVWMDQDDELRLAIISKPGNKEIQRKITERRLYLATRDNPPLPPPIPPLDPTARRLYDRLQDCRLKLGQYAAALTECGLDETSLWQLDDKMLKEACIAVGMST
jgi:hypothetical protein